MRLVSRLLIAAALCWLVFIAFGEFHQRWNLPADHPDYDPTQILIYFLIVVAIGIAAGVTIALTVIPAIGESVGSFFFSPNEEVEKDPHRDALAFVAQGDYEAAVAKYKNIVRKNPDDLHAISEVIQIQCTKLEDYEGAAEYLRGFLEKEHPPEKTAFLAERLVDVYWTYMETPETALPILKQLVETMPGTNHAANAYHRIREIENQLGLEHSELPEPAMRADVPRPEGPAGESEAIPEVETVPDSEAESEPQPEKQSGVEPEKQ